MPNNPLNYGTNPNDKTGQDLRSGVIQIQGMFDELFSRWGANNVLNDFFSVAAGTNNTCSGDRSAVLGGFGSTAAGHRSVVLGGQEAWTRLYGELGFASGKIATIGDAQCGEFVMRAQTTDETAKRLTATGFDPWTDNIANLTDFMAWAADVTIIAKRAGNADCAVWRRPVTLVRTTGSANTTLVQGTGTAVAPDASNGGGSAWRMAFAADTQYGGLSLTFTGAASQTINAVARLSYTQTITAS